MLCFAAEALTGVGVRGWGGRMGGAAATQVYDPAFSFYLLYPRPLTGIPSFFEGVFVRECSVINHLVIIYWFLRLDD